MIVISQQGEIKKYLHCNILIVHKIKFLKMKSTKSSRVFPSDSIMRDFSIFILTLLCDFKCYTINMLLFQVENQKVKTQSNYKIHLPHTQTTTCRKQHIHRFVQGTQNSKSKIAHIFKYKFPIVVQLPPLTVV